MLRRSCSDSHRSILLAKRPSTVLRSNIPLQSTLTPCVVWSIHAGKSMLTNPDKQASRNRGPVHKKTRWTRKIQRKAFLIDYSPSQLIWRTWRRMCSHIPLKERTQIRKVMLRKWRDKKRKHNIHTDFTKKRKRSIPRAEKFDELIAAEHKILSDGSESRSNHRYAVVQVLATQWIQSYPRKTKTSQETEKNSPKFLEPSQKPKVIYTNDSLEFGESCEELPGIIDQLHLIDQRQAELQNELYVEKKKGHQPFYCNLDRMTSGGQIPWNAIAICEMSKISWQKGKLRMNEDLEIF